MEHIADLPEVIPAERFLQVRGNPARKFVEAARVFTAMGLRAKDVAPFLKGYALPVDMLPEGVDLDDVGAKLFALGFEVQLVEIYVRDIF